MSRTPARWPPRSRWARTVDAQRDERYADGRGEERFCRAERRGGGPPPQPPTHAKARVRPPSQPPPTLSDRTLLAFWGGTRTLLRQGVDGRADMRWKRKRERERERGSKRERERARERRRVRERVRERKRDLIRADTYDALPDSPRRAMPWAAGRGLGFRGGGLPGRRAGSRDGSRTQAQSPAWRTGRVADQKWPTMTLWTAARSVPATLDYVDFTATHLQSVFRFQGCLQ